MIYLYILKHIKSNLFWVGRTSEDPTKELPEPRHWKWDELLDQDSEVELTQVLAFRDSKRASNRLRTFRREHRVRTSVRWVNSDCYLDKRTPYVYLIRHIETGVLYLGSQYNSRANPQHLGTKYFTSSDRVKELEWENFEIVELRATRRALALEQTLLHRWYVALGAKHFGEVLLNRCIGGGFVQTEDMKQKMSTSTIRRFEDPAEREKIRQANFRRPPPSEETRYLTSLSMKNYWESNPEAREKVRLEKSTRVVSDQTREKLRAIKTGNQYFLGKKHTDETKAKMSAAAKLRPPTMLGKRHSEETRRRMSLASLGKKKSAIHCANVSLGQRARYARARSAPQYEHLL